LHIISMQKPTIKLIELTD